jgi:hypothetical protein
MATPCSSSDRGSGTLTILSVYFHAFRGSIILCFTLFVLSSPVRSSLCQNPRRQLPPSKPDGATQLPKLQSITIYPRKIPIATPSIWFKNALEPSNIYKRSRQVSTNSGQLTENPTGPRVQRPVKTLYALVIALWLVAGLGMHAYLSHAAQGPATVEEKRDLYLRQFENNDTVASRIRESHWRSNSMNAAAYAAWVAVAALLAIPTFRSWFPKQEKSFDV